MKTHLLTACALTVALASCQKSFNPHSHYKNDFCLETGCECADGYIGEECSEKQTPSSVTIKSIEITSIPDFNNGESWDPYEGSPDVTFEISHAHELMYQCDEVKPDATSGKRLMFQNVNVVLSDVLGEHKIRLIDVDEETKSADIIRDLYFVPYESNDEFVDMKVIKEGDIEARLMLEYEF